MNDELDERYNRAAMMLNMDEKMTIPSRRMTLKTAMLNIGFTTEDVVARTIERHRKAIGRRRDKLRSTTLPATIDITSPANISAVTVSSITVSSSSKGKYRKTRRRSAQLSKDNVERCRKKRKEEESYFEAAKEWKTQKSLPKNERISCRIIVDGINKKNDTSICEKTVRSRVFKGIEDTAPTKGRNGIVKGELRDALLSALRSYIALANANRTTMPNKQKIIKILDKVIATKVGMKHPRKFAERLMRDIALDVHVTTANTKMEKRRLVWSTYNNINTWFEKMKEELIDLGFARLPTAEEEDVVEGELVFFDGQLDRILNIDESEVTTDGTSKLTGGRPVTEYCSSDSRIGTGAEGTNKSGYAATFIGGTCMSGYPVPPHFQVRSLARTEQTKKLDNTFI